MNKHIAEYDSLRNALAEIRVRVTPDRGNVYVSHRGINPLIIGDRVGLLNLGVAILEYATSAEVDPKYLSSKMVQVKSLFSERSGVRGVVLSLSDDQRILQKGVVPPTQRNILGLVWSRLVRALRR